MSIPQIRRPEDTSTVVEHVGKPHAALPDPTVWTHLKKDGTAIEVRTRYTDTYDAIAPRNRSL